MSRLPVELLPSVGGPSGRVGTRDPSAPGGRPTQGTVGLRPREGASSEGPPRNRVRGYGEKRPRVGHIEAPAGQVPVRWGLAQHGREGWVVLAGGAGSAPGVTPSTVPRSPGAPCRRALAAASAGSSAAASAGASACSAVSVALSGVFGAVGAAASESAASAVPGLFTGSVGGAAGGAVTASFGAGEGGVSVDGAGGGGASVVTVV
jgi:hypothetical protein